MTDTPDRVAAALAADLPPGPKLLLLAIAADVDENGERDLPSLDVLAAVTGTTPRTVRRYLTVLVNAGVLEETVRLRVRV